MTKMTLSSEDISVFSKLLSASPIYSFHNICKIYANHIILLFLNLDTVPMIINNLIQERFVFCKIEFALVSMKIFYTHFSMLSQN